MLNTYSRLCMQGWCLAVLGESSIVLGIKPRSVTCQVSKYPLFYLFGHQSLLSYYKPKQSKRLDLGEKNMNNTALCSGCFEDKFSFSLDLVAKPIVHVYYWSPTLIQHSDLKSFPAFLLYLELNIDTFLPPLCSLLQSMTHAPVLILCALNSNAFLVVSGKLALPWSDICLQAFLLPRVHLPSSEAFHFLKIPIPVEARSLPEMPASKKNNGLPTLPSGPAHTLHHPVTLPCRTSSLHWGHCTFAIIIYHP